MEVPEFLSSVSSGRRLSAIVPADMESVVRQATVSGLKGLGYAVRSNIGCACVIDRVQTPCLDEGVSSKTVYIVQYPDCDADLKSAFGLVSCLAPSDGVVVLFESAEYPPKKSKAAASLLSKAVVLDPTEGVGTISWVHYKATEAGLGVSTRGAALIQARIAGNPSATDCVLRTLSLYTNNSGSVSEQEIADAISFLVDADDGRAVLDDLLNQRSLPLSRRLEVIPESKLVPLFRAATSEMIIINQLANMLAAADKGRLDVARASEDLGLAVDRVKARYLPIARTLGPARSKSVLEICSMADTLLLRTAYSSRDAAMAVALSICRQ